MSMPPGNTTVSVSDGSPLTASVTETVASVTRSRSIHWLLVSRHLPVTITDAPSVISFNDSSAARDVADGSTVCSTPVRFVALVAHSPEMTRTTIRTPLKAYNFFFIFSSENDGQTGGLPRLP